MALPTPEALAAEAVAYTQQQTGDPMQWTGRAILDGERVWVEIEAGPGAVDTWTTSWFSDDGHGAQTPADVFAGEHAWLI